MQTSEPGEPTKSQQPTCGSNQKPCNSFSLSLIPFGRIISNPKAGCYYLDQTSEAQMFPQANQTVTFNKRLS